MKVAVSASNFRIPHSLRALALSVAVVASVLSGCKQESAAIAADAKASNTTQPDMYYGDPGAPNISGYWQEEGNDGQPSGLLGTFRPTKGDNPWKSWLVDGKPLPGRGPGGPWVGIPYTPKWQEAYDKRVADNEKGISYGDPHFDCLPRGLMASYHGAGPVVFTLTQMRGRIVQIFSEQQQVRHIFTDGRGHADWAKVDNDLYEPTPHGHSIGHWEGNTLVVDTIGTRREYTMGYLAPHSEMFHMVERITRVDDTHLVINIAVDDAKALAKPMTMNIRYTLQPGKVIKESVCENNRNKTDANGILQTILTPKKSAGWDLPED